MSYCTERFTRLDYCQFLLSNQIKLLTDLLCRARQKVEP